MSPEYDLNEARKPPSKRAEAMHQTDAGAYVTRDIGRRGDDADLSTLRSNARWGQAFADVSVALSFELAMPSPAVLTP